MKKQEREIRELLGELGVKKVQKPRGLNTTSVLSLKPKKRHQGPPTDSQYHISPPKYKIPSRPLAVYCGYTIHRKQGSPKLQVWRGGACRKEAASFEACLTYINKQIRRGK